ncbi:MAG: hypothetical protein WAO76_11785 [Georgfuchsia sp.]
MNLDGRHGRFSGGHVKAVVPVACAPACAGRVLGLLRTEGFYQATVIGTMEAMGPKIRVN